jgi:PAS domain S-box-containing protein
MSSDTLAADIRTNILLVDDRPQNLLALGAILEPLGQNLVLAQSGQQALKHLLETDFAVILLDVLMPGLDGFETAALIKERARTRHIPIIFLTAAVQTAQTVSRGYTLGAVDYISKPFNPEILRAKVAVFVELYRKNEQIHRQNELLRQNEQRDRLREREELRRLGETRYQSLAESMPQIVFTATPDGHATYFNRRWFEYTGQTEGPPRGTDWKSAVHLDDLVGIEDAWRDARQGASSFEIAVRFRRASDGAYRWHLVRALAAPSGPGEPRDWIGTLTDIEDLVRAEKGLRFQADASKLLASSLDWRRTLAAVAELAVPDVADWCTVTLCDANGSQRPLAIVHTNPEKVALAREILARYPDPCEGPWSLARLHAEGRSRLVESVEERMLPGMAHDEEHLQLLRELGLQSWLFVPLFDRGAAIGSIQLAIAESGRRFRPADVELAEDLARRISAAVAIAHLYEAAQSERAALEEASRVKDEFLACCRTSCGPRCTRCSAGRSSCARGSSTPRTSPTASRRSSAAARRRRG